MPPLTSSIVAPALADIAESLDIHSSVVQQLVLSIYVLGCGIGPLAFGGLSETYGRVYVLQLSNLASIVFNVACGFSRNVTQLVVFRFLCGLFGSASLAVDEGVLTDIWCDEEIGKSIGLYGVASLLSPVVGPIIAGSLIEGLSWHWVFYFCAILAGVIGTIALLFFRETFYPRVLRSLGEQPSVSVAYPKTDLSSIITISLGRPLRLLGTQTIIQILAVYLSYLYGLVYLVLSTFPDLWNNVYNESSKIGSLNYISIGLGYIAGSQGGVMFLDKVRAIHTIICAYYRSLIEDPNRRSRSTLS